MLSRKIFFPTRTAFQMAIATVFSLASVGAASAAGAANSTTPPLLVPYTINTLAGTPQYGQYGAAATAIAVGYFGEGVPATTSLGYQKNAAVFDGPFAMAVDSVGNVYITDTANFIIREVNAQTGLVNTIAGVLPKGCSGATCTVRVSGCADGVPAAGAPIGLRNMGIAVDAYGNVYFDENTSATVSVIYRGGTQVANFIALVDPGGVAKSGGKAQVGYIYHVGGTINLSTCAGVLGNVDNVIAFEDSSNSAAATGAQLHGPGLLTLDSAGNIYIADISNQTVRVINTQATPQTFFQFTVQPGYMRSITNCSPALTIPCPTGTTTSTANTGINGPVDGLVYNSQYKESETDAYGNVYQLNGTGGGTGPPGIYSATAYAGGAPLTNLLTAEAPSLAASYPGELPLTYGNSYISIGDPAITSALPSSFPDVLATQNEDLDIRPSSLLPDNFGTFWFMDNHYPELSRIDQYTSLATLILHGGRATTLAGLTGPLPGGGTFNGNNPPSFTNPYYCVYGSVASKNAFTQGPISYDPQGDGCPVVLASFSGGNYQTVSDGLGNIYVGDSNEQLERIITNGNAFAGTTLGQSVTQGIQVHFNSANPPALGNAIPDGPVTGNTTTAFSIAPGISDFTIDTTDPEFPMGSLIGGAAYNNSSTTANFQLFAGLPTCTQLGAYPVATGVTDLDCLVYVTFTPSAPGVRQSQLKVTTANGSVYYFSLSGVGNGGQLAIDGGSPTVVPITGLGSSSAPTVGGIAISQSGTLYVADPGNNRIVVSPAGGGTQSNLAFTGVTPATLSGPMGVALDAAGNVYISDTGNNRILKVTPSITGSGPGVATVLGNYVWIPGDPSTAPPQYVFNKPQGLAVDKWNNVYVADTGNKAVVEITSNIALGGAVPLLNYPGAPQFLNPVAVAVDSVGNVYVADTQNASSQVVKLPPGGGDLVTLIGSSFPTVNSSVLNAPNGVAVDGAGNVYVSDAKSNNVFEILATPGAGPTSAIVNLSTMNAAGTGVTTLSTPGGLALDASGNLYVADTGNRQILFDNRQSPLIQFGNVPQDQSAGAQPICTGSTISDGYNIGNVGGSCVLTVSNIGNAPIALLPQFTAASGASNPAYNQPASASIPNTCPNPIPAGAACTISPTFTPTMDNGQSENVTVNGTQTITLTANGAQPLVNIVLSASYSPGTAPAAGSTATITATVTQPHIPNNTPSGTVTFTVTIDAQNNNANSCGTGSTQTVTLVNGIASFQIPSLAQGVTYTVAANYNGDSLNTATVATPLLVTVPGIPVTSTVTSTAAQLTFTYGGKAPIPVGTVTPALPAGITATYGSKASSVSPIGTYPVVVSFSGTGACAYGFPPSVFSTGGAAVVTEQPAPLSYAIPNFSALYGAPSITYGANAVITGAVNGDGFGATFTPADSSILNVGTYTVTPAVSGADAGNYIITSKPSTLTITQAPTSLSISGAKTTVLNTATGVASAVYSISVGTTVPLGKGIPTGTVTVTDNFIPITATGYGAAAAPATTVVPLTAGVGSYVPTNTTPGIHQYSFVYSGDSNFQSATVAPSATAAACIPSAITTNCLVVDSPDFFLTSNTGPVIVIPGVVPSGNGLLSAPNQSSAAPETAVLFVTAVNGFTGTVNLSCTTQNPTYVNCFMTPVSVCFAATSSLACTNTATTAAAVVAISTPATLPLGFKTSEVRTSATTTVLAFAPFGFLAFCVRRRRRLSKALWMLFGIVAIGAGMIGCGGNQVDFYTPIPTGPQTVTVTASTGSGANAVTRSFVVPIAID